MQNKFIKLKSGVHDVYVNPNLITLIKKLGHTNMVSIFTMDGKDFTVDENIDEIFKKIENSGAFYYTTK